MLYVYSQYTVVIVTFGFKPWLVNIETCAGYLVLNNQQSLASQ